MILPKAFLFDLDGVLLDTEPLHAMAWRQTAKYFGGSINADQIKLLRGRRRIDCAKIILEWIPKKINIDDFLEVHKPISKKNLRRAKPMDGAQLLIKTCYEMNMPMALVTSSTSESVRQKTQKYEWFELIETRIMGDDLISGEGKPSPTPYLLASKKLGIEPRFCWAIEDSESGIISAKDANCIVLALYKNEKDFTNIKEKLKYEDLFSITSLNEVTNKLKDR